MVSHKGNGEKNKILLVVRWPVGGIRTFLKYVYNLFDEDSWEFTIIAPRCEEFSALKSDLCKPNINFIEVKEDPSFFRFSCEILRVLFKRKFFVIHSQGFTSGICSILPSIFFRKPHILTSHDVVNSNQFKGISGCIKKLALGASLYFSDVIHSVSYDAQDNLQRNFPGINKNKMIVIPNGIEVKRFLAAKPKNFISEGVCDQHDYLIGFFGRFMGQKGFRYLIDAVEILAKKSDLVKKPKVIAFGWGGFIREEQAEIKRRNLDGYFQFMPFESNIASAIKGLDVVVMPSLWEACPLLPMETLVCGTPLIATQCVGLREVISGTPTVTIEMNSGVSIASEVQKLMVTPNTGEFKDFVAEATERFDVAKQADQIRKIYL